LVRRCPTCGANNRDDASFCSACGTSLIAPPSVKPVPSVRVVSPVTPAGAPMRVPPPGMCFYHPNLPAIYVCNRCGRPICRDDSKAYQDLVMCPQCYQSVVPFVAAPAGHPAPMYAPQPEPMYAPQPAPMYAAPPPPEFAMPMAMPPGPMAMQPGPMAMFPPARSTWGFILSLIAGILIIINAAALLSNSFYTMWAGIFPWITYFGAFPPWVLVAIGLILGIVVCIGSILMVLGYGTIGAVVVFPAAVISLIIGGGFIAGFILGVVGGILGMLGR
jgi:zinc-ribbon domain